MLDPLLAPALQLADLPVVPDRKWADTIAHNLTRDLEKMALRAADERDPQAANQLANVTEVLAVAVISLVAYSRGKVPRVKSAEAPVNLILPGGNA